MKWENLQQFECPHCGDPLKHGETAEDEITCNRCTFHISTRRYESILEHRGRPSTEKFPTVKWQMLHDSRCPLCTEQLRDTEGSHAVLKCVNAECTFRIREDRLQEILGDPDHSANRFKGRE